MSAYNFARREYLPAAGVGSAGFNPHHAREHDFVMSRMSLIMHMFSYKAVIPSLAR